MAGATQVSGDRRAQRRRPGIARRPAFERPKVARMMQRQGVAGGTGKTGRSLEKPGRVHAPQPVGHIVEDRCLGNLPRRRHQHRREHPAPAAHHPRSGEGCSGRVNRRVVATEPQQRLRDALHLRHPRIVAVGPRHRRDLAGEGTQRGLQGCSRRRAARIEAIRQLGPDKGRGRLDSGGAHFAVRHDEGEGIGGIIRGKGLRQGTHVGWAHSAITVPPIHSRLLTINPQRYNEYIA
jgi:hypothetical protein